ncbi:MAG TPA: EamA family transporter [Candidatus Thermoplasmatota archaeon]|nr:EamA family transporter [Candidatus Thermoplasmatota archaeon]
MARLHAVGGVLAISFSAIFVRAADVSPGTSAFFRVLYAIPVLLVFFLLQPEKDARPPRDRLIALAAGAFFALDLHFWHRSIGYIGAGLATVIGNLQVVLVAVVAWVALRERPTRAALVALPIALAGLALTTGLGRADAYGSDPVLGAAFGILTAFAYTGYLLLLRRSGRARGNAAGPLLDATLGAAVAGLPLSLLSTPASASSRHGPRTAGSCSSPLARTASAGTSSPTRCRACPRSRQA